MCSVLFVLQLVKMPLSQYFEEQGEEEFRDAESLVLDRVGPSPSIIV